MKRFKTALHLEKQTHEMEMEIERKMSLCNNCKHEVSVAKNITSPPPTNPTEKLNINSHPTSGGFKNCFEICVEELYQSVFVPPLYVVKY